MPNLKLTTEGITLDTSGVSFNLTLRSPIGDESGSFVYSFSIPYTLKNAKAYGFPYRLTKFETVQSRKQGTIEHGVSIATGTWVAKSTNGQKINIEMYIAAGDFFESIHEKTLPELFDVELNYVDIIGHIESQVALTYPAVNHNWPCIHNPLFYGEDEEKVQPQYQGILNDWEGTELHVETYNNNAISPQLYLGYIIKRMFAWAGYSVWGNVFDDALFKAAMLYNNCALDRLVPTQFSGELTNYFPIYEQYVLEWDENIVDPGSHYTQSTGKYNVDKEGNYLVDIYIKHRPDPRVPTPPKEARVEIYYGATLIASDQQHHGFGGHSYFRTYFDHTEEILQVDIGDDIWVKFMYKDWDDNDMACEIIEADIVIKNTDAVENNIFEPNINYKNHVPDMDVKEFFAAFCSSAQILPFFNHRFKKVKLVFLNDLLGSNHQRPMEGLHKDSLKVNHNTYEGLKLVWNFQGPDENLNDNFIDLAQADIQGEVETIADLHSQSPVDGHIWFVETLNCYYIYGVLQSGTFHVHEWMEGATYIVDDMVKYDNTVYKCTLGHTAGASFNDAYFTDKGWVPYSDNLYEYQDGDGKEEIPCDMAPMMMRAARCLRSGGNKYRMMPSVTGLGSSIAYGLKNEFPLRIMFWHGIESEDTDQYPLATTTTKSNEGTATLPINWSWEGIISRYLNNVISWYRNRQEVELKKEATPAEIANNDFEQKLNYEGSLLIVSEIYAKISDKAFGPAKIKGWTNL